MFKTYIKSRPNEDISILVKPNNHSWNYLCECGEASDLTVKEIQNCNAIFISHTHIDHFVNFDAIVRHQIGMERPITICGPIHIAKQVQNRLLSYSWNLIEENSICYVIKEMISDNEIVTYQLKPPLWDLQTISKENSNVLFHEDKFQVTGILLDHKIPTLSYLFKEYPQTKILLNKELKGGIWVKELKEAFALNNHNKEIQVDSNIFKATDLFHLLHIQEGDSLGIIMDHGAFTENHDKIKNHFNSANKVFIECFYKNKDAEFAKLNYHSFAKESGSIMKKANVKDPIPVHFSRKYNEDEIEDLVAEFFQAYNR
ncbi:ribonuclease Z [Tenacibaculum sp. MAR_2009_124]|uniref:peptidase n=1 Tax=Tenacibaculum sp. MAR_2009_124 TaxID=1250059 RepID=UPI0008952613|nr:peptidase [Tenacibaculum sp. MAR_2009_124]SEC88316.1 ribonuclease Z [Tenacibaculum sp. MAR_2009_124]